MGRIRKALRRIIVEFCGCSENTVVEIEETLTDVIKEGTVIFTSPLNVNPKTNPQPSPLISIPKKSSNHTHGLNPLRPK